MTNTSQMMRLIVSGAFPVSDPKSIKKVESWSLQSFPGAAQRDVLDPC